MKSSPTHRALCALVTLIPVIGFAERSQATPGNDYPKRSGASTRTTPDTLRPSVLLPGQTVRVVTRTREGIARQGEIQELRRDGVLLLLVPPRKRAPSGEQQAIEIGFAEIERLELRQQTGSHAALGVLAGGIAGLTLGLMARDTESNHPAAPGVNAAVVTFGFVLGVVVGGFAGAASPKYEWINVPPVYYDFGTASPNIDNRQQPEENQEE